MSKALFSDDERYPPETYPYAIKWHDGMVGITYSQTRPEYFSREDEIVRWPAMVPRTPLKGWFGE